MNPVRPELRLVRESLEAVVSPAIVSTVIFEALDEIGGQLPDGGEAVRAFADGSLRRVLVGRLGDDAHAIIDDIVAMLSTIAPSRAVAASPPRRSDADATREVFIGAGPVIVLVVASTPEFGERLLAALGPDRVAPLPTPSIERMDEQTLMAAPPVVLVDAASFAPIEPERLAASLAALPATTVRAIWGADLPYGAALLRALVERGAPATPLDRREGIEPLLDLIRSRRSV
ncbi:MAG: hypothetical protein M3Y87_15710 [Myxococcota bacterium]|nr:hypothetical protein [Myxococcota bacterium]